MRKILLKAIWNLFTIAFAGALLLLTALVIPRTYKCGDGVSIRFHSDKILLFGTAPGGTTIIYREQSIVFDEESRLEIIRSVPWGSSTSFIETLGGNLPPVATGQTILTSMGFDMPSKALFGFGLELADPLTQAEFPRAAGYGVSDFLWRIVIPFWAILTILSIAPFIGIIKLLLFFWNRKDQINSGPGFPVVIGLSAIDNVARRSRVGRNAVRPDVTRGR